MPRPNGGLDAIIYTLLVEPVSERLCGVSPNAVTLVGLLTSFVALYHAIYYDRQYVVGTLLFLFRFYCDCLDGSIARHCGTGSKLGSILDHACDIIWTVLGCVVYWYKLRSRSKRTLLQYAFGFAAVLSVLVVGFSAFQFETSGTEMNPILHDNLVVPQIIAVIAMYIIVGSSVKKSEQGEQI